jgi:xanthine dehydrogenase YagT iron-sulfur-binding subunit
MHDEDDSKTPKSPDSGVSRRDFLKISGITAAVPLIGSQAIAAVPPGPPVFGPGKTTVELSINGKNQKLELEPRVTLLDALRDELDLTGAKRVCDRGECGACTVLMDDKAVYACSVLAIDAQGAEIKTIESLMQDGKLHPVQQAFVDNDATQCGFCTPGFVVATKALLDKHPQPTAEDIRRGLAGNLCRCGTYVGIRQAIAQAQKGA